MIYPAAVLSCGGHRGLRDFVESCSDFTKLFADLNAELPLPTRIVIEASKLPIVAAPFIAVGFVGASCLFRRYYRRRADACAWTA